MYSLMGKKNGYIVCAVSLFVGCRASIAYSSLRIKAAWMVGPKELW